MIPIQFEFVDDGVVKFVRVEERFRFHFTGEILYRVSIQWQGPVTGAPFIQYEVYREDNLLEMLKTRVDL